MARRFLLIGALCGLFTVLLGAFGAHGLEGRLPEQNLIWWRKAVDYQGLHALALLALTGQHWLGMLTPFGGLAFIFGWCALALAVWRLPDD